MHKVIIDTDPGIDDAQAIAFAIAHPEIDLLGLTTVFGNASVELTSRNAKIIAEQFGDADLPVAVGAADPLSIPRFSAPDFVHGADGLGNVNYAATSMQFSSLSAAEFIVEQANAHPGELSLITIGPLTNIAHALDLDPTLPSKVKQLIIMGGCVDEPGNVTPVAEANLINDPHAADIALAQEWPVHVIGLDVTLQVLLGDNDLQQLQEQAGNAGKFLWDTSRFYLDFYSARRQRAAGEDKKVERGCAMHDASAVIYLVQPEAFGVESGPARVICDGVAMGQLALDRRKEEYLLPYWQKRPDINVAMTVDADLVRSTFINTLLNHFH